MLVKFICFLVFLGVIIYIVYENPSSKDVSLRGTSSKDEELPVPVPVPVLVPVPVPVPVLVPVTTPDIDHDPSKGDEIEKITVGVIT